MRSQGLDLGTARAALAVVRVSAGQVALEEALLVDLPSTEELGEAGEQAFVLRDAMKEAGVRARPFRLGVPGRDAILRYVHLPHVPGWRLKLLMADEVDDLAEKAGEPLSGDYRLLPVPDELLRPDADGLPVLVALAKEAPLEARIGTLRGAGVAVAGVTPTAVALFNAWVGLGRCDEGTTVLVDAGPDGTEVVLTREGLLVFARSLQPAGGRSDAELARAVASSLQLARSQQRLRAVKLDAAYVSGAQAASPDFRRELARVLKHEVEVFDPIERVDVSGLAPEALAEVDERGPELVIALGLALTGTHPRTADLELLPASERRRREFRSRTLWLYAAGIACLVTLSVTGVQALLAHGQAEDRAQALRRLETRLESRLGDVKALHESNERLAAVLGGLSERTRPGAAALWLLERLREVTPARVTITELTLEKAAPTSPITRQLRGAQPQRAPEQAGEEAAPGIGFVLEGEVDNAAGDAARLLGRLEMALSVLPRVHEAKVTGTPVLRPGATLEFALAVRVRAEGVEDAL